MIWVITSRLWSEVTQAEQNPAAVKSELVLRCS